jgi:hypothetical protein
MVSGHYSEWRETQTLVPVENPENNTPDTQVALGTGTN